MPATGLVIGTPPSHKCEVYEAHTDAIDVEPFDEKHSDTRRMVYGNSP